MGNSFADTIYVVVASKGRRSEFWAAATPPDKAAAEVQDLLPRGWTAMFTGWHLSPEKSAALKMRLNSVQKLKRSPRRQ
jgi:hypothetical protein